MMTEKDKPNVIAPPPLIFLSGLLLGGIVQWYYPFYIFSAEYLIYSIIAGILLAVSGFGIILTAHLKMKKAQTNIEPWKPTNSIISDGIYSYSRNPIYVAMALIYTGTAFLFNSVWFLPLLVLVLLIVHFCVILREEKYLERKFGDEYLNYKNRVRRWL
jgi:protein-S-isoprenylcysteine O-methyltransferase Ste14